MQTVVEITVGLGFDLKVEQFASKQFRVTYGKQVSKPLSYGEAAREFGECYFHGLACQGNLDNSEVA